MTESSPSSPADLASSAANGVIRSRWPWVIGLLVAWLGITLVLRLVSGSEWWLCAMGAAGALLVIWPGPKTAKPGATP